MFDRIHHLVIRTTLCRLKNYFLSYYVSHIYSIKLICQDNSELLILNKGAGYPLFLKGKKLDTGELAQMVERPLSMREVPGSIPGFSNSDSFVYSLEKACLVKCWLSVFFVNFNGWLFKQSLSHPLTKPRSKPSSPQTNFLSEHLFLCQKGRKLIVEGHLFN